MDLAGEPQLLDRYTYRECDRCDDVWTSAPLDARRAPHGRDRVGGMRRRDQPRRRAATATTTTVPGGGSGRRLHRFSRLHDQPRRDPRAPEPARGRRRSAVDHARGDAAGPDSGERVRWVRRLREPFRDRRRRSRRDEVQDRATTRARRCCRRATPAARTTPRSRPTAAASQDHGVTLPATGGFGSIDRNDPKVQSALDDLPTAASAGFGRGSTTTTTVSAPA